MNNDCNTHTLTESNITGGLPWLSGGLCNDHQQAEGPVKEKSGHPPVLVNNITTCSDPFKLTLYGFSAPRAATRAPLLKALSALVVTTDTTVSGLISD